MANEKILILEAPWSDAIEDTQATHDIYASAETLLRIGPDPVRIIQRPLISSTYVRDIENFIDLDCNKSGPNVIVLSAHGRAVRGKKRLKRQLTAFDGVINFSKGILPLHDKLARSIVILDSCSLGETLKEFHRNSGTLAVIGFAEEVDWIDSSIFVLAMLFKLHQENVLHLKRARRSTKATISRAEKVITTMIKEPYASMAKSLGVRTEFHKASA